MRKILLIAHFWFGLASGLIMLIVATTGALYVFEEELRDAFQWDLLYVPNESPNRAFIKPSDALAIMQRDVPHEKIQQIRVRTFPPESPKAATILVFTKSRLIYSLNPYLGNILGARDMKTDAISIIVELHTELLLGRLGFKEVGEQIVKWNVLIFFIMLLTGIVLWLPMNMHLIGDGIKNALKHSFRVKWSGNVVKRYYDVHRVAGFYSFAVMLMVAWTGIFWVFDSVEDSVYALFGVQKVFESKPLSSKSLPNKPASQSTASKKNDLLDNAYSQALRYGEPYFVSIQIPSKDNDALRVLMRYPYRFVRKQSVLYFDQYTGNLLKSDLHENYTTPDKIRVSNFDLHTGRMFGLPSKILWFFAALFTASLPITGTMLWWKKRQRKRLQHSPKKKIAPKQQESHVASVHNTPTPV